MDQSKNNPAHPDKNSNEFGFGDRTPTLPEVLDYIENKRLSVLNELNDKNQHKDGFILPFTAKEINEEIKNFSLWRIEAIKASSGGIDAVEYQKMLEKDIHEEFSFDLVTLNAKNSKARNEWIHKNHSHIYDAVQVDDLSPREAVAKKKDAVVAGVKENINQGLSNVNDETGKKIEDMVMAYVTARYMHEKKKNEQKMQSSAAQNPAMVELLERILGKVSEIREKAVQRDGEPNPARLKR